ncbi:MAG TPA: SRPBCC family protein [Bacteroidota bacterium]|jgi:activator of HSP90 ATPase|nr:SRPBCC family protein [Bacteroidota bacterium]
MESKRKPAEEPATKKRFSLRKLASQLIKTKTIKQKEFISATPVEIYDALLNDKKHSAFTGAKATCDRRVGGKFTAWDGYITGKNVKLENGRRIIQEWKTQEWPQGYPPSVIEFTFKQKRNGTVVNMVQSLVPSIQAPNYEKGWKDYYWRPLKKYFGRKTH